MKRVVLNLVTFVLGFSSAYIFINLFPQNSDSTHLINQIKARPLDKYSIDNLSTAEVSPSQIQVGELLKDEDKYASYKFYFNFDPTLSNKASKKVSGLVNIPKEEGLFPTVVMFRGYVDQKLYTTGDGTRKAAEYLAANGFITIAPDFLGYGDSDTEASNIFESRFQTYTTALTLLKSLKSLSKWDNKNILIWGHSNGGQIALTILEITRKTYPTVLWAPVSKPFPYSVLYYTDESQDGGKLIRRELAKFEEDYNTDLYSIETYFDRINAPIELHQGTIDDAVPVSWSNHLSKTLIDLSKDINYYVYPQADHNLNPSWNTVIERNLKYFQKNLTN